MAEHFGVPFSTCRSTPDDKAARRRRSSACSRSRIDLVVLARYMQILSPAFVAPLAGPHHQHPPLVPARVRRAPSPYHQAHERGVKLIGATAHYVTAELDQGPIIEQDVCRVSHRDAVEDLVRKGRELERQVLARAVRWHLERRVLISGNRTIVFG